MSRALTTPVPSMVAGVDTHTDTHALAILTAQGGIVFTGVFAADEHGYANLINRINDTGNVGTVGVVKGSLVLDVSGNFVLYTFGNLFHGHLLRGWAG